MLQRGVVLAGAKVAREEAGSGWLSWVREGTYRGLRGCVPDWCESVALSLLQVSHWVMIPVAALSHLLDLSRAYVLGKVLALCPLSSFCYVSLVSVTIVGSGRRHCIPRLCLA